MAAVLASHHASGSCSAQPGHGVSSESGTVAAAATAPAGLTRMAFTPLVPTSRPRNSESSFLPGTEQQLHRELVEPFVSVTASTQRGQVERLRFERARPVGGELHTRRRAALPTAVAQLRQQLLNLGVVVEALDFLFQDQVGAHAAGGEGPDPVLVLRAVGVAVEVPHPGPACSLEQLDEKERRFGIVAPEPQILVEASWLL